MAEAALLTTVEKLGNIAIQKVSSLRDVEAQVVQLKDELQMMQCFLRDADKRQAKDERIRKWIADVREVAFDAEDAIDTFTLKVSVPRRSKGLLGRCVCFLEHVYHLERLGQDIESIQKRLKVIAERRVTYGIRNLDDEAGQVLSPNAAERRRRVSPWEPDKHVVGLEGHVETLLEKAVLVEKEGLFVSSIVGMGGVGKSTLAKKVYNHAAVGQQFESRAWVTVSRDFNHKKLLNKLVLQLKPREGGQTYMENLPEETLEQMVHERLLGTRYFVVLDDVWQQQDLECIARAFPDERDKACRLLITSRVHNIPRSARYVHELEGLNPDQSWQLFMKVAFVDNDESKCPHGLEVIGRRVVEKCNGLPLAISVMGGLLLEQGQSVSKWERVLKGIKTHLEAGEDSVNTILELSYRDLNPRLKSCFLYLSFFKEDVVIMAQMLIALWIAEGIIPRGKGKETMEEIAKGYLDELINRNMVQAAILSEDGQVQCCRMHDLLRDLSINRAKEEINFDLLRDENTSSDESLGKASHLAIWCNNEKLMSPWTPNLHLRSLFFSVSTHGDDCFPPSHWKRLGGCLRVLELGGLALTTEPEKIGTLVGLRYLGLFKSQIKKLPRSLGHLNSLQTLNVSGNWAMKVPNVIWKLDNLRHLYMPSDIICKEPLRLDTLKNLQTLQYFVPIKDIVVDNLAELISLRELSLKLTTDVDVSKLLTLLLRLEHLISIKLDWTGIERALSLDGIVNLQPLSLLVIYGKLEKLPDSFPQNLSYLELTGSELNQDPMPTLGKLRNLLRLELHRDSYDGEEMVIMHGGFPRLKVLNLYGHKKLREMYIENGGLLELKELGIVDCRHLKILPEEQEKRLMGNLQTLQIFRASKETASKLKGDDYSHIISRISTVDIFEA